MPPQIKNNKWNEIKRTRESERNILVIQFNCNSIRNKLPELKVYIYTTRPDIVCLCETFIKKYEPKFIGYLCHWYHRVGHKGGLAVLVRRDIPCKEKTLIPFRTQNLELQCIEVFLKQQWIAIVNVYNPNLNISLEELRHYCSQITGEMIMIGDFNAHSPTWDSRGRTNATGKALEELLANSRLGLLNDSSIPTYIDHRSNTTSCLDLCIASRLLFNCGELKRGKDLGSDHFPIECTFKLESYKDDELVLPKWKYSKANWDKFTTTIESHVTDKVGPLDIHTSSEVITKQIYDAASEAIGKTSGKRGLNRHLSGWDEECEEAVKLRRRCRAKLWKNPSTENLIAWKRARAQARYVIKQKKEESFMEFIDSINCNTPSSTIWKKIKSVGGRSNIVNGSKLLDPALTNKEKADQFLQHFARFKKPDTPPTISQQLQLIEDTVVDDFPPVTIEECTSLIGKLKNTAPGEDLISNQMLKKVPESCIKEIVVMFNISLRTSCLPDTWKMGKTSPIPKPGKDLKSVKSSRPITMLSCIGKLAERVVQGRLEKHLENNTKLGKFQMGFRKGRSTNEALALTYNQIKVAQSQKQACILCFLDLESAFDSVWHEGILIKLKNLNTPTYLLKWLKSYFTDRKIKVVVGTSFSEEGKLEAGVPQGAVLSPTLFNVMLHDLPTAEGITVVSYADDITLIASAKTVESARSCMQKYLNEISIWLKQWQMKTNPQKSSFQIYTHKRNIPNITLQLMSSNIQMVNTQRVLGVIFDSPKLTFQPHFVYLKKECEKRLQVLRVLSSTKWGCSRILLRRVYIAYIRSKIEYGSILFNNVKPELIDKLDKTQNQAMRYILGARRTSPILSLQVESYLPPIIDRFRYLFVRWTNKIMSSDLNWILCEENNEGNTLLDLHREISSKFQLPKMFTAAISPINMIEPWYDLKERIHLDLEDDQNNKIFYFKQLISEKFADFSYVYTDGSKLEDGSTAAAVYIENLEITFTYKLNPSHTIIGAELFAILKALQFIDINTPLENTVVLTDCKSALHIIGGKRNTAYKAISYPIKSLLRKRENIQLQWVKAHIGIKGNEVADRAAQLAHKNILSTRTPLSTEEMNIQLNKSFMKYWDCTWRENTENTQTGRHMSRYLDQITGSPWLKIKERKIETALTRLRIGHAGVNQHLHRFKMRDSPMCDSCGIPETINHFIMECPEYLAERDIMRNLFESLDVVFSIKNVLMFGEYSGNTLRLLMSSVVKFLKSTGRVKDM